MSTPAPSFAGISLSKEEASDMVERYGEAWVSQSPDALVELFCDDGIYFERPGKSIQGNEALKEYWQRTVVQKQSNIEFRHILEELVFDPENLACCAKWEVNFDIMKPQQHRMKLITVAIIRFRKCEFGTHKIESMEEYWHNVNRPEEKNGGMPQGMMQQQNNMIGQGGGGMANNMRAGPYNMGGGMQRPMGMMGGMMGGGMMGGFGGGMMGGRMGGGGGGGMRGDPNDPTCWDFQKGTCTRGDKCKWQHVMPGGGMGGGGNMGGNRMMNGGGNMNGNMNSGMSNSGLKPFNG